METNNENPIKVVITGPESTGKSTLCASLAQYYQTSYVPEYAREYLLELGRYYTESDLKIIAYGQVALEDKCLKQNSKLLICDTSLEVIRVWSEWKYNQCDPSILALAKDRIPDLFLLTTPDFPWQPDPLRENPGDREELFNNFKEILEGYGTKVVEIYGDVDSRIELATSAINEIVSAK